MKVRSPFNRRKLWLLVDHRFFGFRLLLWWIRVIPQDKMLFSDRQIRSRVQLRNWVLIARR